MPYTAPQYAAWFEREILKQPALWKAIQELQGMYASYLAQDDVAKFESQIDWSDDGPTVRSPLSGESYRQYLYRHLVNIVILVASALVFGVSLWLVRSQETVYDVAYMKAMIPHHSIAIMTSKRAHIQDPRVRDLADRIIEAQLREIDEMKRLIADIQAHPVAEDAADIPSYRKRGAPSPTAQ